MEDGQGEERGTRGLQEGGDFWVRVYCIVCAGGLRGVQWWCTELVDRSFLLPYFSILYFCLGTGIVFVFTYRTFRFIFTVIIVLLLLIGNLYLNSLCLILEWGSDFCFIYCYSTLYLIVTLVMDERGNTIAHVA